MIVGAPSTQHTGTLKGYLHPYVSDYLRCSKFTTNIVSVHHDTVCNSIMSALNMGYVLLMKCLVYLIQQYNFYYC